MYVSPAKKRLYTILAVAAATMIPISVLGVLFYQDWRSNASPEEKPQDVRMSDLTETSVVISWITPDKETEGWVQYSDSADTGQGSPLALDDRDVRDGTTSRRYTHYVTLSDLSPDTKYYFVLGSGASAYKDTEGNEFSVTTASVASGAVPVPDPVYGSVTNGDNQGAIVYVTLDKDGVKSFPVSALTNDSGNFEVDLAHIRNAALDAPFDYDDDTEMIIFAQGGNVGGAVLKIAVSERDAVSMTMEENYPVTDVFADSSHLEPGDEDNPTPPDDVTPPDNTTPDDTTPPDEEPADTSGYPLGTPVAKRDVPLTKLILSTSTSETAISGILVTNVTENSFSIVWSSADSEEGSVLWGTTAGNLTGEARDSRDSMLSRSPYYVHHVSVGNLIPETTYYYTLKSGTTEYANSGIPYQITLPATEDSPPEFYSLFGEVSGTGASDSVVYGKITTSSGSSSYVSSAVDDSGTWTLSIGGIRSQNYAGYFSYTDADSLVLNVRAQGNEESETYSLGDVRDDVISLSIDAIATSASGSAFDRGLYNVISSITNLPETAINRITAIGLTVSVILIGYGSFLLYHAYESERNSRWEREVLKDLGV